jgi:hypothetical protein
MKVQVSPRGVPCKVPEEEAWEDTILGEILGPGDNNKVKVLGQHQATS